MQEILHVIGLCPDHITHPDLIDLFCISGDQANNNINSVKYFLMSIKNNLKNIISRIFSIK